jgi:hypothetical protein
MAGYAESGLILMLVLVCAGAWHGRASAEEPIDIGTRLEPFVDRHLIDALDGAEHRLHSPIPAETVLHFDNPWEGRYCGYVTVIKDVDRYRLYYRGLPEARKDGSNVETTCYAESTDGINWTKPNLEIHEVMGTRENNAILANAAPLSHNFAPMLDTRPGVPEDERFKALGGTGSTGLVAFASGDGIHWRKLRDEAVITSGAFDSQNVAFWSEHEQQYVCYLRTWFEVGDSGFRSISRCSSPDFLNWTEPQEMDFGDTPREHLYTNQTRPYFRAPHIYIATAARFMPGRRVVSDEEFEKLGGIPQYSGDCSDCVLITSRGGLRYNRTFMEGFVRPGMGAGNWTSRTNYPTHGIVPTGDGEMSMYIQRGYGQSDHRLQRLTLRTDGFASIHGPYGTGEMVTKPVRFAGTRLEINVATSAAGSVWIELQDADGTPIDAFTQDEADEIIGDSIARTVSWKGEADVSGLAGRPVRLRVILKDADLYSIRFTN